MTPGGPWVQRLSDLDAFHRAAAQLVLSRRAAPAPVVAPGWPGDPSALLVTLVQKLRPSHRVTWIAAGSGSEFDHVRNGDRHHDEAAAILGDQLPVVQLPLSDDLLDVIDLHEIRPPCCGRGYLISGPEHHPDKSFGGGNARRQRSRVGSPQGCRFRWSGHSVHVVGRQPKRLSDPPPLDNQRSASLCGFQRPVAPRNSG